MRIFLRDQDQANIKDLLDGVAMGVKHHVGGDRETIVYFQRAMLLQLVPRERALDLTRVHEN